MTSTAAACTDPAEGEVLDTAAEYYRNIRDLRLGRITADQHRATNRRLRDAIGDAAWERAKAIAIATDVRTNG